VSKISYLVKKGAGNKEEINGTKDQKNERKEGRKEGREGGRKEGRKEGMLL